MGYWCRKSSSGLIQSVCCTTLSVEVEERLFICVGNGLDRVYCGLIYHVGSGFVSVEEQ